MDHMSNQLKKIVGITFLSVLVSIVINAQNVTSPVIPPDSQNKAAQSNSSSDSSSSIIPSQNKMALVSDVTAKAKTDVKDVKLVQSVETAVDSPSVNPAQGSLNLKVAAREAKMDARAFALPDPEVLGEPLTFQATAYALKGRTRSGAYVRRGVIAADPRVLPLGSVVQIRAGKYTGVYTVHDTGGRIKGNIIDVWMPSNKEARQFGRRKIKLHVLKLGSQKRRR